MALSSGAVEKQLWVRRFGAMKEQRNKAKERQGRMYVAKYTSLLNRMECKKYEYEREWNGKTINT